MNYYVLIIIYNDDLTAFQRYCRMDTQQFQDLLNKVSPYIARKDTHIRTCILPTQRFMLTLRFLAIGVSYRSMELTTTVPTCTLSHIIPETVRIIYEVLKEEYLKKSEYLKL